eukprot:COSAG06_NODE_2771_length_6311_cov_12.386671_7_plen_122_part_00
MSTAVQYRHDSKATGPNAQRGLCLERECVCEYNAKTGSGQTQQGKHLPDIQQRVANEQTVAVERRAGAKRSARQVLRLRVCRRELLILRPCQAPDLLQKTKTPLFQSQLSLDAGPEPVLVK